MNKFGYFSVAILVALLLAFAASCGGGGGNPAPPPGGGSGPPDPLAPGTPPQIPDTSPISLLISATPSSGPAPLVVNLFVSATGGREPYEFAWDFENDGIFDSSAQTPYHTYNVTGVARVRVRDAAGNETNGYRTILVNGQAPSENPPPLMAFFGMSKSAGPVPLHITFDGFASGGTPPYTYKWDFDNDGSFDSFVEDPFFTYDKIGTPVDMNSDGFPDKWVFYPTLEVVDAIGRSAAVNSEVNVIPASMTLILSAFANPPTGQAPLSVTFDGGAEGGIAPYEFKWNFGDGESTGWQPISQADHIYTTAGVYQASMTVRDKEGLEVVSGNVTVRVEDSQQLKVVIKSNLVNASVPFKSQFTSEISGGKEPYTYNWVSYSQSTLIDDDVNPERALVGSAIVTPVLSNFPNPSIHFANMPITAGVYDPIVVQLVVIDALGNEAISNAITVTPQPASFSFDALLPPTNNFIDSATGQAHASNFGTSTPGRRSNPAVYTHPFTGITFMFGGDVLDSAGGFTGIVDLTDSAWAYNPNGLDPSVDGPVGWTTGVRSRAPRYPANSWVQLNAVENSAAGDGSVGGIGGGAFPSDAVRYMTPAATTLSAAQFIPRGNAAAIFIHEPVETNPAGAAYNACMNFGWGAPGDPDDPADQGMDMNPMNGPGLGVPVFYVVGGRNASGNALTTVQKYYPPGFGTELLPIDSLEACGNMFGDFQVSNNQVDIWRNTFLAPDRDYWPQVGEDPRRPVVPDRLPGGGQQGAGPLAQLPVGVYGHSGFAIESLPYIGPLPFPLGPFYYIFIMGGKESDGHVSNEFRILDTRSNPSDVQGGGNQNPRNPQYPLWSYVRSGNPQSGPIQFMPVERYDFDVVMQWPDPAVGGLWKVFVFGGTNQNGEYVSQVDVFTFENVFGPNTGTWSTLTQLPDPTSGNNASLGFTSVSGFVYHVFGGRNRDKIIGDVYTIDGSSVIPSALDLIPKHGSGLGYSYGPPNRGAAPAWPNAVSYYRVAGIDEAGLNPYVEKFQVP